MKEEVKNLCDAKILFIIMKKSSLQSNSQKLTKHTKV